ncbi:MAG: nucleotide pyrophosphohydrolase [Phycisphaerae bacterium]|nr:nucleotide pyrophosphohydrolase [Phycisphaerae bacterium]
MADDKTTVKALLDEMALFVKERDWAQFHSPKNLAMGAAIEAAELMEHFQWCELPESREVVDNPEKLNEVKEEICDVLSYVLALANSLDFDLSEAYFAKMKKNRLKYPDDKYHGKYKK